MEKQQKPLKIFVSKDLFRWSFDKRIDNSDIEFIRKDTLLGWAKQKQLDSLTIVADDFWQEVIDKLNSM